MEHYINADKREMQGRGIDQSIMLLNIVEKSH